MSCFCNYLSCMHFHLSVVRRWQLHQTAGWGPMRSARLFWWTRMAGTGPWSARWTGEDTHLHWHGLFQNTVASAHPCSGMGSISLPPMQFRTCLFKDTVASPNPFSCMRSIDFTPYATHLSLTDTIMTHLGRVPTLQSPICESRALHCRWLRESAICAVLVRQGNCKLTGPSRQSHQSTTPALV